jgi:hypothetical protein
VLEQPNLYFAHEPAQARRGGAGRQMSFDRSVKHMLGILGRYTERLIDDAEQVSAPAGQQPDSRILPNPIEIDGECIGFRLSERQDTVGGQPHIAHLGDVVNRCRDECRRPIHSASVGKQDDGADPRHGDGLRRKEAICIDTPVGNRGGRLGPRHQPLQ